ncbi:mitochondrial substrate carrier family protein [Heterostelium album PN500]|uniref:Mitochondrial substrate carrier family protein n=1 Tax=Heterostelium pallidum (strain ATCC 26659 / Pp 5 / PN500) TaxID=670386 RepID=D3BJ50_HETP5|nr:mitochondrial substrate carrier family protein [Heterostelium album PN500]EFA77930.1 mitochondrial substrate carrier family protein [Heterostelium album PN500]|eukprot:XP_020430058.1 mitochondrial substrate carrier family protein [Heterostelium album PN500]
MSSVSRHIDDQQQEQHHQHDINVNKHSSKQDNNNNNDNSNSSSNSNSGQQNKYKNAQKITWDDLDPKKYYFYNMLFGASIDGFMYPLDVVRTRLQVQGSSIIKQTFPVYTGTFNGMKNIYKYEGLRGFYKGFLPSEVGYLSSKIVYFGVYEQSKQYLNRSEFGAASSYLSGGIAELSNLVIWVPFDVTTQKCQIQGHLGETKSAWSIFRQTYEERGIRGLYRGFGATVVRNVPYSAVWWGSYENTKNYLHQLDIRGKLGLPARNSDHLAVAEQLDDSHLVENEDPIVHMLAGLTAAVISTTLSNPLDVAKTRLQTGSIAQFENHNQATANQPKTLSSFLKRSHFISVLVDTVKREGVRALWKGLVPSLLTSAPYSMISIIVYEEVKKLSLK